MFIWRLKGKIIRTVLLFVMNDSNVVHICKQFVSTGGIMAGDAVSTGWQVTLCDPIWHAGSCSGAVLLAHAATHFPFLLFVSLVLGFCVF